ncbi:MAG: Nuclear pore complex protein Nup54 [Marteilia pararefringens]
MPECELFENILTFHLNANYETLVRDDLSNFKKTLLSIILGKSVSDDVSSSSQVPLTICVKNILQLSEKTCTVDFYIMQQQSSQSAAATPRDTANQPGLHTVSGDTLLSFFNQASNAEKLKNQLGVYEIQDKSKITKTDIRNYLNSCPAGIDKIEWQNACKNNPDQSKYLPVVLYGFEELRNRCLVHLNEKKNQIELIKQIKNRLSAIKQMNSTNSASIANFKTKLLTINKRFMNFLCKIQSLNNSTQTILVYEDESFMKITQLHDRVKNNLYNYSLLCENLDNNLGTNASSNMIRGNSSDDPQTNQNYKRILATLKDQQDKLSQLSVKYSDFNLA